MSEIQRVPGELQVRCPECFKSYNIAVDELSEQHPRFKCSTCNSQFWMDRRQAIENPVHLIGYPMSLFPGHNEKSTSATDIKASHIINLDIFNCPKCSALYSAGDVECKKCGVIFFKFSEIEAKKNNPGAEELVTADPEVQKLWEDVLANYESKEIHQNFINAAWINGDLEYAAAKYKIILEVAPGDAFALKFHKEIEVLTSINFEMVAAQEEAKPRKFLDYISFFNGIEVSFRKFKWINLIFIACGFLIVMGAFLPHMRNLIGLGTSILFFTLVLRYYFRII
ncbi:MAG: hypothetical protein A2Z20_03390 [Bdellovibrionales bacterium RBG_16_40_8]|nr:MAG: hypothetical protein A2Z20_03390 [Bdellovibrionales bacterium RBG_16_40_8]